ncbi:hypothetical protein GOP47_0009551 [Adiantum capillus-veneris]|uniref:Uncharacterized protein n=1 Tax=Adiantum capillus-veneris TaxID=13818 RepID=A0A9D4ZJS2_ADICA|nr:hypothetical protein GOP47_0009551 [Adiantum capillus-veneris]
MGGFVGISPGAYFLTNQLTVQYTFLLDTTFYAIRDALTTVGRVQLYNNPLKNGAIDGVTAAVPVTGEF